MNQTEEFVDCGVSPAFDGQRQPAWRGCWNPRISLAVFACLILCAPVLQAYPVAYTVTGTFGTAQGPDSLGLGGKPFTITGTIDSTALSVPSPCGGSCTYNNQTLRLTIPIGFVDFINVPVTFSSGSPGAISLAATVFGIPLTASVKVNLTTAVPRAFANQNIAGGSTVTYGAGANLTTLPIASGTAVATSNAPAMNVAPPSLSFSIQNGAAPSPQSLTVSSPSPINFSAAAASSWLVLNPASGSTSGGGTISVSVDPAKLSTTSSGNFSSSITITSGDASNSPITVPVTLAVIGANTLTASPNSLSFLYQAGGTLPASQSVAVGSTVSALGFTATASTNSGHWLSVTSSGATTPANLTVSVNPAGLTPNTYTGAITLTSGSGTPVNVPVTLTVTAATSLTSTPSSLTFTYLSGTPPPPAQTIAIATTGSVTSFTAATATVSGANWLSASPLSGAIPGSITVRANPTGLIPGTYNGTVTVTPSGSGTSPLIVPVTFNVLPPGGLTATPASLGFGYQIGGGPPGALDLSVGSNGPPFSFTVSISIASGGNWLSASASSGVTPAHITVLANPAGLPPNDYSAVITITPAGAASPLKVPVNLSVTTMPAVVVSATSLAFAAQVGGAAPGPRSVSVSSTGPVFNFQTAAVISVSQPWLRVGPGAASTPASVSVSVNPAGLAPGTYNGSVSISAPGTVNNFISIPVILAVTTGPALAVAPSSIAFAAQTGTGSPAPQYVDLAGTTPIAYTSSASTDTGGPWLAVSPAKGSTPGRITISANPAGLAPGSYSGSVSLSYAGAAKPLVIAVNMTVTAAAPIIQAVTDAASLVSSPLAPLSLFTIWGTGMGPDQLTPLHITGNRVDATLADTQVLFNGAPAPLLMVQAGQINAIVPNSAAGALAANVQVIYHGVASNEFDVQVAGTAPALFTMDSSGKGQGAILNQDTTRNSATNPAAKGSIVVLYANGGGQTNPAGSDGAITPLILAQIPKLTLPVLVQFGGIDAKVLYAGPAPGEVAGVIQINAKLPAGVASGDVPVTVKIGGESSQPGVTVAVQ